VSFVSELIMDYYMKTKRQRKIKRRGGGVINFTKKIVKKNVFGYSKEALNREEDEKVIARKRKAISLIKTIHSKAQLHTIIILLCVQMYETYI
jgi:hypothetical protein